jgi:hypothetical protein
MQLPVYKDICAELVTEYKSSATQKEKLTGNIHRKTLKIKRKISRNIHIIKVRNSLTPRGRFELPRG